MLNSCIYEGLIRHRRNLPRRNQFDFRSFLILLDLDELKTVFANRWLWSTSRPALARFKESDHLSGYRQAGDLRSRALAALAQQNVTTTIGSIRLLTQLRYFGFAMNPVSFFYCYDASGARIEAIIAEVNNTPWGEQHVYVIPSPDATDEMSRRQATVVAETIPKDFHVSPFMPMDLSYRMAFSVPSEKLGVKIENHLNEPVDGTRKILDVTMLMKRKPLTALNLNLLLIRYPLITLKIFAGIYWQAFRLYLRKTSFFSHPQQSTPGLNGREQREDHLNPSKPVDLSLPIKSDPESVLVSR